ncbi:6-phosphofructokinase, partial [Tsukamurella conjunctivitidis]
PYYDRDFLATAFEAEGQGLFDVRSAVLGHLQQGGAPSPFDRLLATRLVHSALEVLADQFRAGTDDAVYIGTTSNTTAARPVDRMEDDLDKVNRRPRDQWWMDLRPVLETVSLQNSGNVPTPVSIMDAVDPTE